MAGIPDLVSDMVERIPAEVPPDQEKLWGACAGYYMTATRSPTGRIITREARGIQGNIASDFFCHLFSCCTALAALLSKNSALTRDRATAALMTLSIDVPSKQIIVEHCLDQLLQLLAQNSEKESLTDNIKAALLNCSEDPVASRRIQETMSPSEAQRQLGPLPQFAPSF